MRRRVQTQDRLLLASPSLALGHRTINAMEHIFQNQDGKNLPVLLEACRIAELGTKYSSKCCEIVAHSKAIAVIFRLIPLWNRKTEFQYILR